MEQVSQFRYLGSLISEDEYCTKEIHSRIEMTKEVFMEKKKLFTGKMSLQLKNIIMKCLVWSVALYAAETSMDVEQTDRRRLKCNVTRYILITLLLLLLIFNYIIITLRNMRIWRRAENIRWLTIDINEEVHNVVWQSDSQMYHI